MAESTETRRADAEVKPYLVPLVHAGTQLIAGVIVAFALMRMDRSQVEEASMASPVA